MYQGPISADLLSKITLDLGTHRKDSGSVHSTVGSAIWIDT